MARTSKAAPARAVIADERAAIEERARAHSDELQRGEMELAGEVVDATGGAIVGALVTSTNLSGELVASSLSRSDGTFMLRATAGGSQVCARAEAYSEACTEATAPSTGHVLTLVPASTIVGKVLERATGRPLVGASVIAVNHNGLRVPERRSVSAGDGSFTIAGLAVGGYELVAISSSSRSQATWVTIAVGETSSPVTLWADPAVLLSGVLLVGEEPCARGYVLLSGPIRASQPVLSDGSVQIAGVIPGRYETRAHCGAASVPPAAIDVGSEPVRHTWRVEELSELSELSEENEESQATIPSGGSIQVTIAGALGKTSRIFAEGDGGMPYRGRRTGSSTFLVEGLRPGGYRVFIDDQIERAQQVRVAHDTDVIEVQLTAQRPAWIAGRVSTDTGIPVPDAWVSHYRSDAALTAFPQATPVLTDEQGAFRLLAMPGVDYTVMVSSPLGDSHADGVKADRELSIRLSLPASLSGRVQTAEGGAVPDFTLTYGRLLDPNRSQRRGARSTFHVPMLEPGSYRLQVDSALGSSTRDVELAPAEEVTVTMTLGTSGDD